MCVFGLKVLLSVPICREFIKLFFCGTSIKSAICLLAATSEPIFVLKACEILSTLFVHQEQMKKCIADFL